MMKNTPNNDCKAVQPLLAEYVDGVLPNDTQWKVKLHLSSCSVCALVADEFAQGARLLSGLERQEPSANFDAMLARRLADVTMKPRRENPFDRIREWWNQPRLRPAFGALAAAAALLPVAVMTVAPRGSGGNDNNRPAVATTSTLSQDTDSAAPGTLNLEAISEEHVLTARIETLDTRGEL